MSIPLCRAFTPFALEIMIGRLPCAAGSETPSAAGATPKSFGVPTTAVPAREVRKNLRRDHRLMGASLELAGARKDGGVPPPPVAPGEKENHGRRRRDAL